MPRALLEGRSEVARALGIRSGTGQQHARGHDRASRRPSPPPSDHPEADDVMGMRLPAILTSIHFALSALA
jgi:hypothetical protein